MRRAVIATAGTVAGLVALLGYKSSGTVKLHQVSIGAVGSGAGAPASTTVPSAPSTSAAAGGSASPTVPTTATPTTATPTTAAPTTATPTTAAPTTAAGPKAYTGSDVQYFYGDIQVSITVEGNKITKVSVPRNGAIDGRSQMINSYAVPVLEQEALAAQSLNFNVVSGATYTSDAFGQSFQSALQAAHL